MPFIIKTTFNFAGVEQGWSETFYWSAPDDNLSTAEDLTTPLAQKRAKLLANGYVLTVVRNAVVQNESGAKLKRVTDLYEPRLAGVAAWSPSTPNLAMMCVWQTADNKFSKKLYMRGIPAGIGDLGKTPDFSFGVFGSNFNSWRSAMITFRAGWIATSPTQTAVINSYTVDADTGTVTFALNAPGLTFVTPPGFPTPIGVAQPVYIKLPGKSPLDGKVSVVPASNVTCFTAKAYGVAPFIVGQIGTMQIYSPTLKTLAPLTSQGPQGVIHPQRIITHKTGRPTYASRGKRSGLVRF